MFSRGLCRSEALAASVRNSWHFKQGEFSETEIVKVEDDAACAKTLNGNCGCNLCSWRPERRVLRGACLPLHGKRRLIKVSLDSHPAWRKLRLLSGSEAGVVYHNTQSQAVAVTSSSVVLLAEIGVILRC